MGISSILGKGATGSGASAAGKSAASTIAKNVAPALTKAVSGAGAATNALGGAAFGVGQKVAHSVFDAFEDPGYILFVVGLASFLLPILQIAWLTKAIALFLLFFSSFFVLRGKAIFTTTVFFIWYIYLGAPSNIELILVNGIWYLAIVVIIGMIVHGIFSKLSKSSGESFTDGAAGELVALIPIGLFLLHVGLVEFLMGYYDLPLNETLQILLYCIPWWALLGVFTTKKNNALVNVAKLVLLLYIVSVFIFMLPGSALTKSGENLAGVDTLIAAKQQSAQEMTLSSYQVLLMQVQCYTDFTGSDPALCVAKKKEELKIRDYCIHVENAQEDTPAHDTCVKEQQKKTEEAKIQVSGSRDPTIKQPTRAELIVDQYFPREVNLYPGNEYKIQYPIQVKITNPREQIFLVEVNCNFTKMSSSQPESFQGIVVGGDNFGNGDPKQNRFAVGYATQTRTLYCNYPDNQTLNGSYKITFTANLSNLNTISRLSRVFIGSKDDVWRKNWISNNKILNTHFPDHNYASVSPEDFARLNFGFGHSSDYPIIEANRSIVLNSMIENIGPGEITAVHSYKINLEGFNPLGSSSSTSNMNCLEGKGVPLSSGARKDIYLPGCIINSLPFDLTDPEMYVYREFDAELNYDYVIKREETLKVSRLS
jgi:hypothetical protein